MKKVGAVLLFIVSGMFAIVSAVSFSDDKHFTTDFRIAMIVFTVVFSLLGIFILRRKNKVKTMNKTLNTKKPRKEKACYGKHVDGLPVASGTDCTFFITSDGVVINAAGTAFGIDIQKITDMQIKTDSELQQQYVSSVGGAVAGAVFLGPLGAILGGRAKKKTVSRKVEHFLIVTYCADDGIKYIVIGNIPYFTVNKAIRENMKDAPRNAKRIEL